MMKNERRVRRLMSWCCIGVCLVVLGSTSSAQVQQPVFCSVAMTELRDVRPASIATVEERGSLVDLVADDGCYYVIDHTSPTLPMRGDPSYGIEMRFEVVVPPAGIQSLQFQQRFQHAGGAAGAALWLKRVHGGWHFVKETASPNGNFDWSPTITNPAPYLWPGTSSNTRTVVARVTLFNNNVDPTTPMPCDETYWDEGGGKGL